jgi:hypothetical protein
VKKQKKLKLKKKRIAAKRAGRDVTVADMLKGVKRLLAMSPTELEAVRIALASDSKQN